MMLTANGAINDIDGLAHLLAECELTESSDPAARHSFLVMVMSKGLAIDDAHYSACELELDELLQEA